MWCHQGRYRQNGRKEIYLPWRRFNENHSPLYGIDSNSLKMAEHYHPNWNRLNDSARKLMARNCYQVLGDNLDDPVDCIVCYTKTGGISGGTGQAMRIAVDKNIPIFNIQYKDWKQRLWTFMKLKEGTI